MEKNSPKNILKKRVETEVGVNLVFSPETGKRVEDVFQGNESINTLKKASLFQVFEMIQKTEADRKILSKEDLKSFEIFLGDALSGKYEDMRRDFLCKFVLDMGEKGILLSDLRENYEEQFIEYFEETVLQLSVLVAKKSVAIKNKRAPIHDMIGIHYNFHDCEVLFDLLEVLREFGLNDAQIKRVNKMRDGILVLQQRAKKNIEFILN